MAAPLFFAGGVDPSLYDQEQPDRQEMAVDEMNNTLLETIKGLRGQIYMFKKQLYEPIVPYDTKHNAGSQQPMFSFHAKFLQVLAYWISHLDSGDVPQPEVPEQVKQIFQDITNQIMNLKGQGKDSQILAYNLLQDFSTQNTFQFKDPSDDMTDDEDETMEE